MDQVAHHHQLVDELQASWPIDQWQGLSIVVAVSGGADSVALVSALSTLAARAETQLVIAHFNHQWRDDAGEDALFVEQLAQQLGWKTVHGQAAADEVRSEQAARDVRYAFLLDVARTEGARFVVTGHTADDQVETILDRIVRGTGLRGLAGIPRTRVLDDGIVLLRPLLGCRKSELQQYLHDCGQSWREDESNQDRDFTRNRIRHQLLPLLKSDFQESVEDSLLNLAQIASQTQQFLGQLAGDLAATAVRVRQDPHEQVVTITLGAIFGAAPLVVREMLVDTWCQLGWPRQSMGLRQWNQLLEMMLDPEAPCQQTFPGNVRVTREEKKSGGQLLLTRRRESFEKDS